MDETNHVGARYRQQKAVDPQAAQTASTRLSLVGAQRDRLTDTSRRREDFR